MSGLRTVATGAALTMAMAIGATQLVAQVPMSDEGQITIGLNAEGAGQVGEATLTPAGEATMVAIELTGAPTDGSVEGFLVSGTCAEPGEVIAELGAIEADAAGSATLSSEVPIDLETMVSTPLVVELRQEGIRMACGQHMAMSEGGAVPSATETMPASPGETPLPDPRR